MSSKHDWLISRAHRLAAKNDITRLVDMIDTLCHRLDEESIADLFQVEIAQDMKESLRKIRANLLRGKL